MYAVRVKWEIRARYAMPDFFTLPVTYATTINTYMGSERYVIANAITQYKKI